MKNILKENILFPIIIIGPNSTIETCTEVVFLTTTTELGFKNKSQINNRLVDSKGDSYKTIEAKKIKRVSQSWKFWKTNPMYETELFIIPEMKQSLQSFKHEVVSLIKINSEFWTMNTDLETLIQKINQSNSFEEIIIHLVNN